ncbi:helix-turn-helix domain-containing protein [Micromonospora sp. NPDC005553]|uniref:helix-turn-helix domain-containing protein n=1 Tax=Micromonospora sp. NPDC005553 TaxID=3364232 RepID=UPI003675CFA3
MLLRDRDAMTDLVTTVLGPLTTARGGAEPYLETLTVLFDNQGNHTATARQMHLSVRAITYRLDRIRDLTGYHPGEPTQRFTLQTAKAAQHAAPVFMYQLAYQDPTVVPGTGFPLGSPHASDIPTKFANVGVDQLPGKRATARHMSALWAGFAHYGHPTARGVPKWPAYTPKDRATMWIDPDCRIAYDPDKEERLFWQRRD